MPNRTNVPTPPANQARSTLQVVSYAASTDQYTSVVDLNDGTGTSWQIVPGTLKLGTPEKKYVESDNIRAPGTTVVKQQYGNMKVSATFTLRGTSYADIIAKVRALVAAIDNPKATPYALRIALPSATQYSYAWVLKCKHDVPLGDTRKLIQQALTGITIAWDCAPGYLGDRLTLQNLAVNPGFEQPMGGGTAQTAPLVFADTLANFNAYVVQAGGALAQDITFYPDVVQADAPLHYYRMDEPSGGGAFDAGTLSGGGTYLGSPTLGAASLLTGDADTAVTFAAASSQRMSVPSAGLPTGNSPITVDGLIKITANPAAQQTFFSYGNQTKTNLQNIELSIDTSGRVVADVGGATLLTSAALTLNAPHYVALRWDGTTLTLNVDAAAKLTATPGTLNFTGGTTAAALAAGPGGGAFFSGTMDEWAIYGTALSDARIAAHQAQATSAPAAAFANSLKIPAAGRVAFGSPAWGAVQTWQCRFRYVTGLTASFYLHYTDASNSLRLDVASGANGIKLVHRVSGVDNVLAQATPGLAGLNNGTHYWLMATQFPSVAGNPPYLIAEVHLDLAGSISGNTVASFSTAAFDAVTALVGQPQIAAAGAALGIGGGYPNQQAVSLFGPGAWFVTNSGTGTAAGAWDGTAIGASGTAVNTFPNGPAASYGAARLDCGPAGTVNASWTNYTSGFPNAGNAIPVAAAGNALGVAARVHSSGLGVAATQKLSVREYDTNGTLLRTDTGWIAPSLTGNQAWPAAGAAANLSGTYTTGASCAYLGVSVVVADTNAGASAGGIVWIDNVSVWNKSVTNQDGMDYHELRFPNSPIAGFVSGLQGDLSAPALASLGTIATAAPSGTPTWTYALARRSAPASTPLLTGIAQDGPPATLDATAFGGWYSVPVAITSGVPSSYFGWNTGAPTNPVAPMQGQYHLYLRAKATQSTGNIANVSVQAKLTEGIIAQTITKGASEVTPAVTPFAAGSLWTLCDVGLVNIPIAGSGAMRDLNQIFVTMTILWKDTTAGALPTQQNWYCFLPVDASILAGSLILTGNDAIFVSSGQPVWVYADGLAATRGQVSWTFNFGDTRVFDVSPATGVGGAGTSASDNICINQASDPFLTLDPSQDIGTAAAQMGVNQLMGFVSDSGGNQGALPLLAELQYTPTYLYPR